MGEAESHRLFSNPQCSRVWKGSPFPKNVVCVFRLPGQNLWLKYILVINFKTSLIFLCYISSKTILKCCILYKIYWVVARVAPICLTLLLIFRVIML